MYRSSYKSQLRKTPLKTNTSDNGLATTQDRLLKKSANQPVLTPYAQNVLTLVKQWLFAVFLFTVPVVVLLFFTQQEKPVKAVPSPTAIPEVMINELSQSTPSAQVIFAPTQAAVIQGELFSVSIRIDNTGEPLATSAAVVRYRPTEVVVDSITFSTAVVNGQSEIDNTIGKIRLTSQFSPVFAGNGEWATVVFKAVNAGMARVSLECESQLVCSAVLFTATIVQAHAHEPTIICTQTSPPPPQQLTAQSGPGAGEVTLKWQKPSESTRITVWYGTTHGYYQYGVPNAGNDDYFVVRHLVPGQEYFFTITATNTCATSQYSQEVTAKAGFGTLTQESMSSIGILPPIPLAFIPHEASSSATLSAILQTTKRTPQTNEIKMAEQQIVMSQVQSQTLLEKFVSLPFILIYFALLAGLVILVLRIRPRTSS